MDNEQLDKLKTIFQLVLEVPDDEDVTTIKKIRYAKWDSLATVSLVAAIEGEFGVSLTVDEQVNLTSFAAAQMVLDGKLG